MGRNRHDAIVDQTLFANPGSDSGLVVSLLDSFGNILVADIDLVHFLEMLHGFRSVSEGVADDSELVKNLYLCVVHYRHIIRRALELLPCQVVLPLAAETQRKLIIVLKLSFLSNHKT